MPRKISIEAAVREFYAALKRRQAQTIRNPRRALRARTHLVVTIDVTGFSNDHLKNLRGKITEACYPRDNHYPSRGPRFALRRA